MIFIIIVIIVLVIGGFLIWSFVNQSNQNGGKVTGTNFLSSLLPFGKGNTTNQGTTTAPANVSGFTPGTNAEVAPEKLNKISSMPIAGFGIFMKERFVDVPPPPPVDTTTPTTDNSITTPLPPPQQGGEVTETTSTKKTATKTVKPTAPATEFIPAVRYVEKATGNIDETFADNIAESKLTTTLIPQVHDEYFGYKGQSVLMRFLNDNGKTIETFIGALPTEVLGGDTTTNTEIKGSFLPENISSINISPDTSKVFYLFTLGDNSSSAGVVADSLGNKKVQVFNSPLTEWLSWWSNSRMISMTTKPSSNVPGYMYAIDPDKKNLNKILSNINGLTTLTSPSGKLVLFSDSNLNLSIYNTDTKTSQSLGVRTLAEKCAWSKLGDFIYCAVPKSINQSGYPDVWYQGEASFTDQIWKITVADGTTNLISDPSTEKGEDIDGIKLALDENGNYLFFVNKKDSYLWELNLK